MLFDDTYNTISFSSQGIYKEKGSKFMAFAFPVSSEETIKIQLAELRKEYHDARHHSYAYCLGYDKSVWRVNDDGEPSGTAGKPIFGQIQSNDLTNILIVVIRYFGGIKLGIPGLINAYRTAAKEAIGKNSIVKLTIKEVYDIKFEYLLMNEAMKILKEEQVIILEQTFGNTCIIRFSIRRASANKITGRFQKQKGIKVSFVS
jgi:uncharacterized YigZ family protein